MKSFIKIFVLVIVCTMTVELSAQSFGVRAGLNFSNIAVKDDIESYSDDYEIKTGYHIGGIVEFPLTEIISFETGLFFSTKGYKISTEETYFGETYDTELKMDLSYLDIPLMAKASFDVAGTKVYGMLGPYLGIGLIAKLKYKETHDGETEFSEDELYWGSDEAWDDLKRLDFGLNLGAGVEIKGLQIGLTYGLGLANISPNNENGFNVKNRVIGLSVGYKFGGKEE